MIFEGHSTLPVILQ